MGWRGRTFVVYLVAITAGEAAEWLGRKLGATGFLARGVIFIPTAVVVALLLSRWLRVEHYRPAPYSEPPVPLTSSPKGDPK